MLVKSLNAGGESPDIPPRSKMWPLGPKGTYSACALTSVRGTEVLVHTDELMPKLTRPATAVSLSTEMFDWLVRRPPTQYPTPSPCVWAHPTGRDSSLKILG